jgi:hypothetical protein
MDYTKVFEDWIKLSKGRVKWCVVVDTLIKLRVP